MTAAAAPTNLLSMRDASGDTKRVHGPLGPLGFPQAIAIDGKVYVAAQFAAEGDIGGQTAAAFESLVASLRDFDADMPQLVNLRTYYVYEGAGGKDVTDYWEKMTEVRLRYLADPGPAATALRVVGAPASSNLIAVDGVAAIGADRQRIMPEHAWDWSIPTPLSQGWRVGDTVYIGGQISADRKGKAVAAGNVAEQTRVTLEFIRHVLADAGHDWSDLATMRVCYQAGGSPAEGQAVLDAIMAVIAETIPAPLPTISAFGVDLLYEGLMLEIDGVSVKREKQPVTPPGCQDWMRFDEHPVALLSGKELYVGGLSAPGGASLVAQTEASIDRLNVTLRESGLGYESLVKLTVMFVPEEGGYTPKEDIEAIKAAITDYIDGPAPAVSILQVKNLPFPGQRVQIDAVAIH